MRHPCCPALPNPWEQHLCAALTPINEISAFEKISNLTYKIHFCNLGLYKDEKNGNPLKRYDLIGGGTMVGLKEKPWKNRLLLCVAASLLALTMAACGGGGGGS